MDKKPRFAVWLTDPALIAALKLEATKRGMTQRAAVTEALQSWLQAPPPAKEAQLAMGPRPLPQPLRTAEPTPQKPAGRRRSPQPAGSPTSVPLCKQCGHMEQSHFRKACLVGCYCRRFVKP